MATTETSQKMARARQMREQKRRNAVQEAITRCEFETPRFDHDITTGKGRGFRDKLGNVKFRKIVDGFNVQYDRASIENKRKLVEQIFMLITTEKSMKFLIQVKVKSSNSRAWIQQPISEAFEKIRQRLRDGYLARPSRAETSSADACVTSKKIQKISALPIGICHLRVQPNPKLDNCDATLDQSRHHPGEEGLPCRDGSDSPLETLIASLSFQSATSEKLLAEFTKTIIDNIREIISKKGLTDSDSH